MGAHPIVFPSPSAPQREMTAAWRKNDLFLEFLTGTFPGWSVPKDIGRDYLKQFSAKHRVEEREIRGHVRYRGHQRHEDNHYLDCELQVMMVGLVTKLIGQLGCRQQGQVNSE
jgi:hypothetical protein